MILYFFYSLTILSSIFMILSVSPINSILFLIFVFINISMIFIILNMDFLGFIILIVYVGAIAVLFLFVVMLYDIKRLERNNSFYLILGTTIIILYLFQFCLIIFNDDVLYVAELFNKNINVYDYTSNIIDEMNGDLILKKLGKLVYLEYYPCLLLCGVILFIPMIGAVLLTYEYTGFNLKKEHDQILRNHYIRYAFIY